MSSKIFFVLNLALLIIACNSKKGHTFDKKSNRSTPIESDSMISFGSDTEFIFVKVVDNKIGMLQVNSLNSIYLLTYKEKYPIVRMFYKDIINNKILLDSTRIKKSGGVVFNLHDDVISEFNRVGVIDFKKRYTIKVNNSVILDNKIYSIDKKLSILYVIYINKVYKIIFDDYLGVFYLE